MNGWIRDQVFFGWPMRNITVPARFFRELDIRPYDIFTHFDDLESTVMGLLCAATGVPTDSRIVGIARPANLDAVIFTIIHKSFPPSSDGLVIPEFAGADIWDAFLQRKREEHKAERTASETAGAF